VKLSTIFSVVIDLVLLAGCDIIRGSQERDVITVIEFKSDDCEVYLEKHTNTERSDMRGGVKRASGDERRIILDETQ
jgi:hypothetical protein